MATAQIGGIDEVRWPLIRYGALVVAFCAFLIGVFFIFQGLIQQRALVEKESRISIWFVAQVEIEFLRLSESLKTVALAPTKANGDEAKERFEIFWSRLTPLLSGSQTAGLREIEGVVPSVRTMIRTLEEIEPEIGKLPNIAADALAKIDDKLDDFRAPLKDLVRHTLLYESSEVSGARNRHSELYLQLLGLFVLTLAGGLAVFVMLFIQTVKTHRAVVAAATSAEAAISARNELELAINSISEGFIIYNADDTVALFNKRYVELHPLQAEVFAIGVHFRELLLASVRNGGISIPPDQVESWIQSCLRQRRDADSTFESELAGGKWLKISERRTTDGRIVGVHTDITELKEREHLINQKSALLQTTLDNMKQGIVVFDADFSLLLFNDRYIDVNKYPDGFVYPRRKYQDVARFSALRGDFGPGEADALVASQVGAISQLLRDKKGSFRQQRRLPDGRVVETVVTALPTGGFVKTYEDITERVRSEAERAQLTEKYHAAQKTQALGTLAGGIAHDFNNIIGSILGNCSLLMIDTPKEDPGYERLRQIIESGTRARDLVRQILTYSRNAESERKPLELGAVVKDSLTIVNPLMPSNISLQVERMDECLVSGDATQIHQVLLNLCLNAAQAIGTKEGKIKVSVQPVQIRGTEGREVAGAQAWPKTPVRGQSGTLTDGRYARVTVRDTGAGIDEETMPRIFEPFFTTKEVGEGTGLGLAAVQGIVRNHEGVVSIESIPGVGTSFSIYLPQFDGAALPSREQRPAALSVAGKERILLVDDDRALLSVTKDILMRLGYSVDAFAEPLLALAAFREKPNSWDLVITDRAMPRVPGEALAKEMKGIRPNLPILMLSGFISAEEDVSLRKSGINSVISKPVLPDEIGAAVRAVIVQGGVPAA